jgi:hypothetical protein
MCPPRHPGPREAGRELRGRRPRTHGHVREAQREWPGGGAAIRYAMLASAVPAPPQSPFLQRPHCYPAPRSRTLGAHYLSTSSRTGAHSSYGGLCVLFAGATSNACRAASCSRPAPRWCSYLIQDAEAADGTSHGGGLVVLLLLPHTTTPHDPKLLCARTLKTPLTRGPCPRRRHRVHRDDSRPDRARELDAEAVSRPRPSRGALRPTPPRLPPLLPPVL